MLIATVPEFSFTAHLLPGLACLYGSGVLASFIFAGRHSVSPGFRALLHWLPIAVSVIVSLFFGWDHIAVSLIFGSAICLLTCAVGSLGLVAPIGPAPEHRKAVWRILPATALIIFVIGFKGIFRPMHGVIMLLEGLAVLSLWREPVIEKWQTPESLSQGAAPNNLLRCVLLVVVILVAAFGAMQSGIGTQDMTHSNFPINEGLIASFVWSLVLVNPIMLSGRKPAHVGASWLPMTAQVGVVLLNLCVLIPLVCATPYLRHWSRHPEVIGSALGLKTTLAKKFNTGGSTIPVPSTTTARSTAIEPRFTSSNSEELTLFPDTSEMIAFPLPVWRIDCVLMLLVSLMLLPVAVGKWNLSRVESGCLLAGYAVYLFAGIIFGA